MAMSGTAVIAIPIGTGSRAAAVMKMGGSRYSQGAIRNMSLECGDLRQAMEVRKLKARQLSL